MYPTDLSRTPRYIIVLNSLSFLFSLFLKISRFFIEPFFLHSSSHQKPRIYAYTPR